MERKNLQTSKLAAKLNMNFRIAEEIFLREAVACWRHKRAR